MQLRIFDISNLNADVVEFNIVINIDSKDVYDYLADDFYGEEFKPTTSNVSEAANYLINLDGSCGVFYFEEEDLEKLLKEIYKIHEENEELDN